MGPDEMLPAIDTTQFRDAMKNGHRPKDGEDEGEDRFTRDQGVELVHASDTELFEELHPIHTVRDWMGTSYQKQEDGKWKKIGSTNKLKVRKKEVPEEEPE